MAIIQESIWLGILESANNMTKKGELLKAYKLLSEFYPYLKSFFSKTTHPLFLHIYGRFHNRLTSYSVLANIRNPICTREDGANIVSNTVDSNDMIFIELGFDTSILLVQSSFTFQPHQTNSLPVDNYLKLANYFLCKMEKRRHAEMEFLYTSYNYHMRVTNNEQLAHNTITQAYTLAQLYEAPPPDIVADVILAYAQNIALLIVPTTEVPWQKVEEIIQHAEEWPQYRRLSYTISYLELCAIAARWDELYQYKYYVFRFM